MECKRVKKLLELYCYGELARREIIQVKKHLRQCEDCRREALRLKRFLGLVREKGQVRLPLSFRHRLLDGILTSLSLQKRTTEIFVSRWPVWVSAAAAIVLVLVWMHYWSPLPPGEILDWKEVGVGWEPEDVAWLGEEQETTEEVASLPERIAALEDEITLASFIAPEETASDSWEEKLEAIAVEVDDLEQEMIVFPLQAKMIVKGSDLVA